jgi:hypothetical protein
LDEIQTQILLCDASAIVEVITEVDNKQITTGAKRNNLLNKAQGSTFVSLMTMTTSATITLN